MVALFPMPVQERAAFVKENDVASMSVREVEERVREAVAQEKARADALEGALETAANSSKTWEKIANAQKKKMDEDQIANEAEVRKLREQADKLKKKIKALEDAPVQERIVYKEKEPDTSSVTPDGATPSPTGEGLESIVDNEAQARVDALVAQLDEVQGKLKAAEDKAALMAQKADARVQAVNFALREISDKLLVIGDAVDGIRGGTTGDGELADKLAASAVKAIKAMLEGAGWYQ
jgi:DNA repair exonuclease SbcCD ATPase subunit